MLLAVLAVLGVVGVVVGAAPSPVSTSTGTGAAGAVAGEALLEVRFRSARQVALRRLAATDRAVPAGRFATVTAEGRWLTEGPWTGWLAGFHPGALWTAYELSGNPVWSRRAVRREQPLAARAVDTASHDLGFLLQTSFGRAVRLRGRAADADVVVRAARSLATRWVPAVRAIRSWDGPPGEVTVIVDSTMNLELLLTAAQLAGDDSLRRIAVEHARTVARVLVRADGSTVHAARLDERTGAVTWSGTVQGVRDSSTWARGQAWAVHGFTTLWRATGDPAFLETARATAGWAVDHLPSDGVPWWDSDAIDRRDASAGAVLASGLLELGLVDPDPGRSASWVRAGRRVLAGLTGPGYLAHTPGPAALDHVRHSPERADVGTSYADLYLLEALQRAQLLPSPRPALRPAGVRPGRQAVTVDLGRTRAVSAVSVRWSVAAPVRFRLLTARDAGRWSTARSAVSSGTGSVTETYDVRDRGARFVRLVLLDGATRSHVATVRVRGQST